MRKYGRKDTNQHKIEADLAGIGLTVQDLSPMGDGCPDLLVGFKGRNYLFEIKDPDQPPSKRKLTQFEKRWREVWKGQVHTVMTTEEIINIINGN
jgi:uncharacterized protein Usg